MALTMINLTLLKVNEEIENLLACSPTNRKYQIYLNDPDFRQKLMAYILSRIPNRHLAVEVGKEPSIASEFFIYSTQERLQIENRIHQGIDYLLQGEETPDLPQSYRKINSIPYSSSSLN
jgi:hypothetical protein